MSTASASLDRSALGKAALSIFPGGVYRFTPDGLGTPAVSWRIDKAPDVPGVHGSEALAAAKEESSLPWTVLVMAASREGVGMAFDDLAEALDQWSYPVTVTVDGASRTWQAGPANYSRGPILSAEQDAFLCTVTVSIPVYPIPS